MNKGQERLDLNRNLIEFSTRHGLLNSHGILEQSLNDDNDVTLGIRRTLRWAADHLLANESDSVDLKMSSKEESVIRQVNNV